MGATGCRENGGFRREVSLTSARVPSFPRESPLTSSIDEMSPSLKRRPRTNSSTWLAEHPSVIVGLPSRCTDRAVSRWTSRMVSIGRPTRVCRCMGNGIAGSSAVMLSEWLTGASSAVSLRARHGPSRCVSQYGRSPGALPSTRAPGGVSCPCDSPTWHLGECAGSACCDRAWRRPRRNRRRSSPSRALLRR